LEGINDPKGNWKREWSVTPPAFIAAIPVGAATMSIFRNILQKSGFSCSGFSGQKQVAVCLVN